MKLSELKSLIDRALLEDGDMEVELSLDVSNGQTDFDHRLYGDVLEFINQGKNYCIACELKEDNWTVRRKHFVFLEQRIDVSNIGEVEKPEEGFEVYNRETNRRYTVYARLKNTKLPLNHYDIENSFVSYEDAFEFMRLLNVEGKYETLFCLTFERQKDGSYKEVK